MKILKKLVPGILLLSALLMTLALPALAVDAQETDGDDAVVAEEQTQQDATGAKAIGCAIAVGLAAAGGAVGMGVAVAKSADGISRQPEAEGKIRSSMMLGLVFIETAIIYALLVAILIIFVL
jgi:F-type H+-transporting ATPase subunit c